MGDSAPIISFSRRQSTFVSQQIPPPMGFLPLNDSIYSPRGSTLHSIIRSNAVNRAMSIHDGEAFDPGAGMVRTRTRSVDSTAMGIGNVPNSMIQESMRSMRLIGNSNPRYRWEQYRKSEEELKKMKKAIKQYYKRNNYLITQYLYIDRLLDSSLPHNLIQEYNYRIPQTITEESHSPSESATPTSPANGNSSPTPMKRTPKTLFHLPQNEETPLLNNIEDSGFDEGDVDGNDPVVSFAIAVNFAANAVLLIGKLIVILQSGSLSVLASLVDAVLDFLSTAIVFTTTRLTSYDDHLKYPAGRRKLEPIGVLVFSVVMITSFVQVGLQCIQRLASGDHEVIELGLASLIIMTGTVVIKGLCWFWCRLIKNSSVQALAQDAKTDVVFNSWSIVFPLVGFYARIWWLDASGGLLLSLYVIWNWSQTCAGHIRNLSGGAASADERNVLLYLTMRFAKPIRYITGFQAYHSGDKLNVEADIILDPGMALKDSHDLGESLQYVLESVPTVDRAFVHIDYDPRNLPTHMAQRES